MAMFMTKLRNIGRASPGSRVRAPFWYSLIFSGIVLAEYMGTGRVEQPFILLVAFLPSVFSLVAERLARLQRQNEALEARIAALQAQVDSVADAGQSAVLYNDDVSR
jgi:hypothetical protein